MYGSVIRCRGRQGGSSLAGSFREAGANVSRRSMPPTDVSCPLCGSKRLRLLTERLRFGPGRVWFCDSCEIGVLDIEGKDLRDYYAHEYRERHGPRLGARSEYPEIFAAYVDHQGARVDLLRPWLKPGSRLLEVGCSTGHFLYNVKDMVGEVVGVDYDADAAEHAAKVCGCETFGCDLAETGLPIASFDVVCAMQVLEHVEDPVGFLELVAEYVKPTGIVYVEVPNLHDPLLSVYGVDAYRPFFFHEAHQFYFTAASLSSVAERAGLEGEIRYLQEYNFLNHIHWLLREEPQGTNQPGMGAPALPAAGRLGENVKGDLDAWSRTADREYREMLVRHGATDVVAFLGTPRDTP